jgi:hypothetical protein
VKQLYHPDFEFEDSVASRHPVVERSSLAAVLETVAAAAAAEALSTENVRAELRLGMARQVNFGWQ